MNHYTADKAILHQELEVQELSNSDITLKLLEMGIMPGKTITLLYKAPLGDPLAFQLGNTMIALRKREAQQIKVVNRIAVYS